MYLFVLFYYLFIIYSFIYLISYYFMDHYNYDVVYPYNAPITFKQSKYIL